MAIPSFNAVCACIVELILLVIFILLFSFFKNMLAAPTIIDIIINIVNINSLLPLFSFLISVFLFAMYSSSLLFS